MTEQKDMKQKGEILKETAASFKAAWERCSLSTQTSQTPWCGWVNYTKRYISKRILAPVCV
ncbi:hypothetical protein F2P79_008649 [Pimephales promelas]|nr:hypothetical protein F2P79_008649 [Pimephales promelas]